MATIYKPTYCSPVYEPARHFTKKASGSLASRCDRGVSLVLFCIVPFFSEQLLPVRKIKKLLGELYCKEIIVLIVPHPAFLPHVAAAW
jgi:hypothetical protein